MSDVQRTIEAVWKIESTRLIAGIARVTRDIGIAENSPRTRSSRRSSSGPMKAFLKIPLPG